MPLTLAWRVRLVFAVAMVAVLAPASAQAQIGGLLKKAKQKVIGSSDSSSSQAAATPASSASSGNACGLSCLEQHLAITPDLVDRFIKAMRAELAERDRLEREHANDGVGRLYAARDFVVHCDSLHRADSVYQAGLIKRAYGGGDVKVAAAAMQELAQLPQRQQDSLHLLCQNKSAPHQDANFYTLLQSVQARQDTVGALAGGFTVLEFTAAVEKIAGYALSGGNHNRINPNEYPPSAMSAMDGRMSELIPLLKREFNLNGTHETAEQVF